MAQSVGKVLRVALCRKRVAGSRVYFGGDSPISCGSECVGLGGVHEVPYSEMSGMDGGLREGICLVHTGQCGLGQPLSV